MKSAKKLGLGSFFAIFGAAGIILRPLLGFSKLAQPWSFFLVFVFGLSAGVGVVLSLAGLLATRKGHL